MKHRGTGEGASSSHYLTIPEGLGQLSFSNDNLALNISVFFHYGMLVIETSHTVLYGSTTVILDISCSNNNSRDKGHNFIMESRVQKHVSHRAVKVL